MRANDHWFLYAAWALFAAAVLLAAGGSSGCSTAANSVASVSNTVSDKAAPKMEVPASIAAEHKELHEALDKAVGSGGKTGDAARAVADRLSRHFEKEEEFALPPLGLLVQLAEGKASAENKQVIELSEKLKANMPAMLQDHKEIVAALEKLIAAAKEENKPDAVEFAHKLMAHAQGEEQIMYPAAILVGEYLKLKAK